MENEGLTHKDIKFKKPFSWTWYPGNNAWQISFPRRFLNKHEKLAPFRDFLVECHETVLFPFFVFFFAFDVKFLIAR